MEALEDGTTLADVHGYSYAGVEGGVGDARTDHGLAELPFHDQLRFAPGLRNPQCSPLFQQAPFDELLARFEAADEAHAEEPNEQTAQELKHVSRELAHLASEYDRVLMALQEWWQVLQPTLTTNFDSWVMLLQLLGDGGRTPDLAYGLETPTISAEDRDACYQAWDQLDERFMRSLGRPNSENMGEPSLWYLWNACKVRAEYVQLWRSGDPDGRSPEELARFFLSTNLADRRHLDAFELWFEGAAQMRQALNETHRCLIFGPLAHLGEIGPTS